MKLCKASVTVEAAVIVPLLLVIFGVIMHVFFYLHDRNVVAALMQETLAIKSEEAELKEEEVEDYFLERLRNKLLLFSGAEPSATVDEDIITLQCSAKKQKFRLVIEMQMTRTEPENYIRRRKQVEEIGGKIKKNEYIF